MMWDEDEWQESKRDNDYPYVSEHRREMFRKKRKRKKDVFFNPSAKYKKGEY